MRYRVEIAGRALSVEVDARERFLVNGAVVAAEARALADGASWVVTVDGRVHEVVVLSRQPLRLQVDGIEIGAAIEDPRARSRSAARARGGAGELRAPMPGLVKAVRVREGDVVEDGGALVTLEAMKMENELRAHGRCRVLRVAVTAGTKVEGGALLLATEAA